MQLMRRIVMMRGKVADMSARVQVINEVCEGEEGSYQLCFQWCRYLYGGGGMQYGYRFIWRREDGSLQPARGQARIPSVEILMRLVQRAKDAGWGDYDADELESQVPA